MCRCRNIIGFVCGLSLSLLSFGILLPLCIVSWLTGKFMSRFFPRSSVVSDITECGWRGMTIFYRVLVCCMGREDHQMSHDADNRERSLPGNNSTVTVPPHIVIGMPRISFESPTLRPPVDVDIVPPKNKSTQKPASSSNDGSIKSNFTYEELIVASNNFSEENLIGQGGFARVHRGILSDGRQIAIKHLEATNTLSISSFQEEAKIIGLLHHRHLVSLMGCCTSEEKRILVYEYVPNRTVSFHLHGNEDTVLDWPKRLKISLGAAKGLAYLHEDCQPRVIHRDVKADNILLDNSFEAKVADLGIAKYIPDDRTHISTRAMGTFGYMDPEYLSNGQLTDKSDVFSFGVVLLELITGRKPIGLADWARPLLAQALDDDNYTAIADPRLENDYNLKEMSKMAACAQACIQRAAALRPPMSQIVRALEELQLNHGRQLEIFRR